MPFTLLYAIAIALPQDVRVEATLSAARIGVGETTTLRVEVQAPGSARISIELPPLPDAIAVLGTQDIVQTQTRLPGGTVRVAQRVITLTPNRAGEFTLPAIPVTVDGRRYYTSPLALRANPAPAGATPSGITGSDVKLRVRLAPDTVYVGEQAILEVEALFPRDLRQRQSRPASFETPSPPGFWVTELPESLIGGVRMLEGTVYETQTYRRAYFPLEAGRFALDPARLRYELRRAYLVAPESRELVSDSPRITVRPLPEEGRPASFTGAVGQFTMQASVRPSAIAAGDAAVLTVAVSGTGNVKALPPPRLPALPNVEVYPPNEESAIDAEGDRIAGVKTFSWVLVPERAGPISPGAIEYAFFDPETERYAIARSAPLELNVSESGAPPGDARETRGVHGRTGGSAFAWVRSPVFAALQAVPLLLLIGAVVVRRARRGPSAARRRARTERDAALAAIRAAAATDTDREFLGRLAQWVRVSTVAVSGCADLRTAPAENVRDLLASAGVDRYAAAAAAALLRRLDQARFAAAIPFAERDAIINEASEVVARIARRSRAAAGTVAGLLLLCLATPVHATPPDSAFTAGVGAFVRGNYTEAVTAFEDYTRLAPTDANGWYNLGNAFHAAGRRGSAVWAWRRALELNPRLTDARHNLRVTGAGLALVSAPTPLMPTRREAAFGLAVVWWIGAAAGAVRLLRRSRAAATIALVCAALALLIGLAALPAMLRPTTVITLDAAPLHDGPDLRSDVRLSLEPGTPLVVVEIRNDWLLLRTIDRAEGWGEAGRFGSM